MSGGPADAVAPSRSSSKRTGSGPTIATVLGLAVAAWGGLLGLRNLTDNSFFTHLATGRLILEAGAVPTADPYSYTAPGAPWVVQSWLASVFYGGAERIAGLGGVRAVTAVLGLLIAGGIWWLTKPARSLLPRVALSAMVLVVAGTTWTSRPFMFGLAGMVAVLLVIEDRLPPWVLIPVFWIWANTHGSFPLGLVAIGCFALGRKLDGEAPNTEIRILGWAALGSLLSIVSPLGLKTLTFPVELLGKSEFLGRVVEWQSPSFSQSWTRFFLIQVVVAVLLLVRRPTYRAAVPLVVFTALSLYAVRNIGVAGLVFLPGMARGLRDLGSVRGTERGPVVSGLAALVVAGSLFAASVVLRQPHLDLSAYPVDALAHIDQAYRVNATTCRLVTPDTVGNVLELLHGSPPETDRRVFLDDRYDMYPPELMRDYLRMHGGSPGWDEVLDRWNTSVLLWERTEPLAQLLVNDPGWRVSYTDARWIVLVRRDAATACRR